MRRTIELEKQKMDVVRRIEEMRGEIDEKLEQGYSIEECREISEKLDKMIEEYEDIREEEKVLL